MSPDVFGYLEGCRDRILRDLVEFASIPSVSADPVFKADVERCGRWLADRLGSAGLERVRLVPTAGHPIVYGEWTHAPGAPTLLIYGHYDVQPVEPLHRWLSDPFKPEVRDERLYGRGVSDDKGPVLIPILVVEAFLATTGRLPVNVKFLIEGEEESGSGHLEEFIRQHAFLLAADFVLSADGAMWRSDEPSLTVASRGLAALEFTVTGPCKDLHSGRYGGGVPNPIHALVQLAASLHTPRGRVAVDGFYDQVADLTPAERAALRALSFDEPAYLRSLGLSVGFGEPGYSLLERQWARPTLELNGLGGGYQGNGGKTVIPSEAHAKITCRLVPEQDPRDILRKIVEHLEARTPSGTRLSVTCSNHVCFPYRIPSDHIGLAVAASVLEGLYGKPPVRVMMGASEPVCDLFRRHLKLETVFFSFSTADEDYHAPNEFFRLRRLHEGLEAWATYWQMLAKTAGAESAAGVHG